MEEIVDKKTPSKCCCDKDGHDVASDEGTLVKRVTADNITKIAWLMMGKTYVPNDISPSQMDIRELKEMFGCNIFVAEALWGMLVTTDFFPEGGQLCHLMWILCFTKKYSMSNVLSSLCGNPDPKCSKNGIGCLSEPPQTWNLSL
eukprot:15114387-Ditylum_brightwellii.AAC.1